MVKLDIIQSFVRMLHRTCRKMTENKTYGKTLNSKKSQPIYSEIYHQFLQNSAVAALLVQVFGINVGNTQA